MGGSVSPGQDSICRVLRRQIWILYGGPLRKLFSSTLILCDVAIEWTCVFPEDWLLDRLSDQ
jgi:hypothetical protein